jgi:glycosyltransferase involved in cell wall biosynthesis
MVHVCLEMGGAERQSLHLARFLQDRCGAEVEMWGLRSGGTVAELCDRHGIAWRIVPFTWPAGNLRKVRDLSRFAWQLRKARPDVLMPYTVVPNAACCLVWPWTGAARCIWNQRGVLDQYVSLRCQGVAARRAPCLIANARHTARSLVEQFHVDPQRVHVVHNGIDLDLLGARSGADWRHKLGIDSGAFVACMLARLSVDKDHATLLRAWRRVVDRMAADGPAPVLLLAGRAVDTMEISKALAFDLQLERSVRFLGHVDDIPGLLQSADLAVFSSPAEGCPNGLLECMAAGLPIAATDNEGVREAVGPANERFLVSPGDAEAMAELILELARRGDERMRAGRENRERVASQFSYAGMGEATARFMAVPEWLRTSPCVE